jgi:hypothetical protein
METKFDFISRGYSHQTSALYVYCDHCGSFNIRSYVSLRKWLFLFGCAWILLAGGYASFRPHGQFYWIILSIVVCFIVLKFFWGKTDYKCRKCRQNTSSSYNTRDYPSDPGILDVPNQSIEKLYVGYWPDECDPVEMLKPPTVVPAPPHNYPAEILQAIKDGAIFILGVLIGIIYAILSPVIMIVGAIISDMRSHNEKNNR